MQKLTLELPEPLFQKLTRIAELIAQPLESLALQSITGNLPPSVENFPLVMQAELSKMQLLRINQLFEIAHSQISDVHSDRHQYLLEKNQQSEQAMARVRGIRGNHDRITRTSERTS
ncbi:MAG: hypothetical protein ACKO7R_08370 [Pseudanabaena sp.]